jgi:hypothetical protein
MDSWERVAAEDDLFLDFLLCRLSTFLIQWGMVVDEPRTGYS